MAAELDRKQLTFEQAEGAAPLPEQLKLKELSRELRSALWHVFYQSLEDSIYLDDDAITNIGEPWDKILYDMHVNVHYRLADEFSPRYNYLKESIKSLFVSGDYIQVFGFVQRVLRYRDRPYDIDKSVSWALKKSRAAYRLVDGDKIMPVGSEEELQNIERALVDLAASELGGARAHLRNAASELTNGNWAASVRDSIHAVESVARSLEPRANTLGPALSHLEKTIRLHSALKSGFGSLYGYTSDEKGVRHAMLGGDAPQVDETDALYMLGSCAAFVSYLVNKARLTGLLPKLGHS